MKKTLCKLAIILCAGVFVLTGLQAMFLPVQATDLFAISYNSSAGISTIRSDLGGLFLSMGLFLVFGLRASRRHWIMATIIIILAIIFGRLVGMVLDEFTLHLFSITAIEVAIVAAISAAYVYLKADDARFSSGETE